MYPTFQLQVSSGLLESVAQVAAVAGGVVLVLMIIGLGGFAYKSLQGDGIEWPDEESDEEEGVDRGSDGDEWDYY